MADTEIRWEEEEEQYYGVPQWQLIKKRFLRNRLGTIGGVVVLIFYIVCVLFPGFFSTYDFQKHHGQFISAPPQRPRFIDAEGSFSFRPFVYDIKPTRNLETFSWDFHTDTSVKHYLYFFVEGDPYKLLGLVDTNIHLVGTKTGTFFLFGTDRSARDLYSRILYGGQISLTVGLVGVALTVILGTVLGTLSGYKGGLVDNIVQRIVELLMSFPAIPLWAALAAIVPHDWSPIKTFFAISTILALKNWTGLARQLRAKVLSFREKESSLAALSAGASDWYVIYRHMIPNCLSHIIVVATLAIPGMILAETSLSFLGLGIQPPMTSWGVLLQEAQQVKIITQHPWLMIPAIFVIVAVLGFNFFGDALRDAADPFSA